jgi:hypothetical protein
MRLNRIYCILILSIEIDLLLLLQDYKKWYHEKAYSTTHDFLLISLVTSFYPFFFIFYLQAVESKSSDLCRMTWFVSTMSSHSVSK